MGVGYRELPRNGENINRDKINFTTIFSNGTEYRNETFYNVVLGTDYHINKNNVITLSGNFAYEVEDQPSRNDFMIEDQTAAIVSKWYREEITEATNPKYQYELQYKKDFRDQKEHDLLFSAVGNFFGKDLSSEFHNINVLNDDAPYDQQTRTKFKEGKHTIKLDYTRPFTKNITLETGAQYLLNDVSNDFAVADLINGIWVRDAGLTNIFEYDQKVLGIYGTGAFEDEKWGLKLGIRLENTDLKTLLVNTNQANSRNVTHFFPSAHSSYKVTEWFSLQAGYSRRIYRPRLWDLNPFFNIRNTFSVRAGNPDLLPEFTDSYELGSIFIFDKTSLNFNVYHRYTTDIIERISVFNNNVNTSRPENIGTNRITGLELNGKYSPHKIISFNGDINYNTFNRKGIFESSSFDFSADRLSGKLTAKIKLPADIDFEITGQYRSKYKTVQAEVSQSIFADMGLRKKFLKGRGVLNLSVRDIFASRIRESIADQPDYYLYYRGQRGRFITVGFSYGFGKGEAIEYSGQRRRL